MLAKTIKSVMASAVEAEMKALFMNAQLLVEHRQTLLDLIKGHQPAGTKGKHVTGLPVATRLALATLGAAMA